MMCRLLKMIRVRRLCLFIVRLCVPEWYLLKALLRVFCWWLPFIRERASLVLVFLRGAPLPRSYNQSPQSREVPFHNLNQSTSVRGGLFGGIRFSLFFISKIIGKWLIHGWIKPNSVCVIQGNLGQKRNNSRRTFECVQELSYCHLLFSHPVLSVQNNRSLLFFDGLHLWITDQVPLPRICGAKNSEDLNIRVAYR